MPERVVSGRRAWNRWGRVPMRAAPVALQGLATDASCEWQGDGREMPKERAARAMSWHMPNVAGMARMEER